MKMVFSRQSFYYASKFLKSLFKKRPNTSALVLHYVKDTQVEPWVSIAAIRDIRGSTFLPTSEVVVPILTHLRLLNSIVSNQVSSTLIKRRFWLIKCNSIFADRWRNTMLRTEFVWGSTRLIFFQRIFSFSRRTLAMKDVLTLFP